MWFIAPNHLLAMMQLFKQLMTYYLLVHIPKEDVPLLEYLKGSAQTVMDSAYDNQRSHEIECAHDFVQSHSSRIIQGLLAQIHNYCWQDIQQNINGQLLACPSCLHTTLKMGKNDPVVFHFYSKRLCVFDVFKMTNVSYILWNSLLYITGHQLLWIDTPGGSVFIKVFLLINMC